MGEVWKVHWHCGILFHQVPHFLYGQSVHLLSLLYDGYLIFVLPIKLFF